MAHTGSAGLDSCVSGHLSAIQKLDEVEQPGLLAAAAGEEMSEVKGSLNTHLINLHSLSPINTIPRQRAPPEHSTQEGVKLEGIFLASHL